METIDQVEKLLQTRSYQELTSSEKELVQQLIDSEAEYEEMRRAGVLLQDVNKQSSLKVSNDVWRRIRKSQRANRSISGRAWYATPIPSYAAALLVISVGIIAWFVGSQSAPPLIVEKTRLIKDTVFVASKPDTIIREKVVYRKVVERIEVAKRPEVQTLSEMPSQKGVTMMDKEELGKLLVSGHR